MEIEFKPGYFIDEKTCTVRSSDKKMLFGNSSRIKKGQVLKTQKNGHVNVIGKSMKVSNIYEKAFGRKYENNDTRKTER